MFTLVDDHEVGVAVLVDLANSTEKESNAGVLIINKNSQNISINYFELMR